jgi:hypothetical protein
LGLAFVSRAASGIEGVVSAITGIITIAVIVIVWALFALHRLAERICPLAPNEWMLRATLRCHGIHQTRS